MALVLRCSHLNRALCAVAKNNSPHIGCLFKTEKIEMKIDVYQSKKNDCKFLSVESGLDVTTLNLPSEIDPDLLELSLFKTELELDPSKPRVAVDQVDVERQIGEKGYAIHGAKVEVEIK